MQYRITPLLSRYSPSELLNGREICTKLDAMVRSLAHVAQGIQAKVALKSQENEQKVVSRFPHQYKVGAPCYALFTTSLLKNGLELTSLLIIYYEPFKKRPRTNEPFKKRPRTNERFKDGLEDFSCLYVCVCISVRYVLPQYPRKQI